MCFERFCHAFLELDDALMWYSLDEVEMLERYTHRPCKHRSKWHHSLYSIHTVLMVDKMVPNALPGKDERSGKACAIDRASLNVDTHSDLNYGTSG